jgi:hypothetical protein
VCGACEDHVVIHARYGFEGPPVEVLSFLNADAAEARVDVS